MISGVVKSLALVSPLIAYYLEVGQKRRWSDDRTLSVLVEQLHLDLEKCRTEMATLMATGPSPLIIVTDDQGEERLRLTCKPPEEAS